MVVKLRGLGCCVRFNRGSVCNLAGLRHAGWIYFFVYHVNCLNFFDGVTLGSSFHYTELI